MCLPTILCWIKMYIKEYRAYSPVSRARWKVVFCVYACVSASSTSANQRADGHTIQLLESERVRTCSRECARVRASLSECERMRETASQQCEWVWASFREWQRVWSSHRKCSRVWASARECERVGCVVSRTVSEISLYICHIFAFDIGVPLFNALVWGQLREYRHELYILKNYGLWTSYQWIIQTYIVGYLARFSRYHRLLVKFLPLTGWVRLLGTFLWGGTKPSTTKFRVKNPRALWHRIVQTIFRYLDRAVLVWLSSVSGRQNCDGDGGVSRRALIWDTTHHFLLATVNCSIFQDIEFNKCCAIAEIIIIEHILSTTLLDKSQWFPITVPLRLYWTVHGRPIT